MSNDLNINNRRVCVAPNTRPSGLRLVTVSPLYSDDGHNISVSFTPCEASRLGAALIAAAIESDLIAAAQVTA